MKMSINSMNMGGSELNGVQFLFDNGWVLSIIVGRGAYCDTRYSTASELTQTCEISVWNHTQSPPNMIRLEEEDTVIGHFPVSQLSQLMKEMSPPSITAADISNSVRKLLKEPF